MRPRAILLLVVILSVLPGAEPGTAQASLETRAAETAVLLSEYEAQGNSGYLYEMLHLDAKVLIPADAVYGWYENAFFPNGPGVITVTNVEIVSWTWGVTGITYPQTAEVSFVQPFATGETVEEVVRLVEDRGSWNWFFGRSQKFVNEQIARYAPQYAAVDDAVVASSRVTEDAAPWGLDRFGGEAVDINTLLNNLPDTVNDHTLRSITTTASTGIAPPSYASDETTATYITLPETVIPSGELHVYTLAPGVSVADGLSTIASTSLGSPGYVLWRESRSQTDGILFMFVELYANDAVGNVPVLYWGTADGKYLVGASMLDHVSLRMLVTALTLSLPSVESGPTLAADSLSDAPLAVNPSELGARAGETVIIDLEYPRLQGIDRVAFMASSEHIFIENLPLALIDQEGDGACSAGHEGDLVPPRQRATDLATSYDFPPKRLELTISPDVELGDRLTVCVEMIGFSGAREVFAWNGKAIIEIIN